MKIALLPQRVLNSYNTNMKGPEKTDIYKDGDFVIRFVDCDPDAIGNDCERELDPFYKKWRAVASN